MRRVGVVVLVALVIGISAKNCCIGADAQASSPAPEFQEVYDLIRGHLPGISEGELNQLAVQSLVTKLGPKVALVGGQPDLNLQGGPLIKTSNLFEGTLAYLRVARVDEGLAKAIREAREHIGTNKLSGLVLDLRFVGGDDYNAAAETAELFIAKERPLMDWGKGVYRSKAKSDAFTEPVAILINGETSRAAEALAAVLRDSGAGLLLGNRTAGQAMVAQEYPLKNGQRLRIAAASIQVGENTLLSVQGIKPDIQVDVSPQDEMAYYADAYKELIRTNSFRSTGLANAQLSGTNRLRRPRFNEAELVRERREGFNPDGEVAAARSEGEIDQPLVRDPALARALDVLKGLAVVRHSRS